MNSTQWLLFLFIYLFFFDLRHSLLAAVEAELDALARLITWQDLEKSGNGSSGAGARHRLPYSFNEHFGHACLCVRLQTCTHMHAPTHPDAQRGQQERWPLYYSVSVRIRDSRKIIVARRVG